VFDNRGNLFGEIGPGQSQVGAIGELSPGSGDWTYSQLYSFFCGGSGCPDGFILNAPPIWDPRGDLWGMTYEGGINDQPCFTEFGCGVIFAMSPNGDGTWTYHVMHKFASFSADGQRPYGSLVLDKAGNFYGGTWLGGSYNNGTIFKFGRNKQGKWVETILYDFPDCHIGCQVDGTLAMDGAGNLYGTASGGTNSCGGFVCGVVFRLAPQPNGTWKYTMVYNFNEVSGGMSPFYGVILDGKGHLFGVTSSFGAYGGGTAFEISQ
jgi:hypothetical protein